VDAGTRCPASGSPLYASWCEQTSFVHTEATAVCVRDNFISAPLPQLLLKIGVPVETVIHLTYFQNIKK
jgi:hypothetical protein